MQPINWPLLRYLRGNSILGIKYTNSSVVTVTQPNFIAQITAACETEWAVLLHSDIEKSDENAQNSKFEVQYNPSILMNNWQHIYEASSYTDLFL